MDAKSSVAAIMKLPTHERLERLLALSAECIAQQEDATPLLSLIQMELNAPDSESVRPISSSTASKAPLNREPKAKSMRRQLKEKRDELRLMLAKVDSAMDGSSGKPSSAASSHRSNHAADSIGFSRMSRVEQLQLARQSGSQAVGGGPPRERVEVPEHIKTRFREEYDADPEGFRKTWEAQTPEFRRLCSEPGGTLKPPTPKGGLDPQLQGASSLAHAHRGNTALLDTDALLRRIQGGGRAKVSDARAARSSMGGVLG